MPTIAEARSLLGTEVTFLFASDEDADQIRRFGERRGFDFDYVRVLNQEALGIQALPTTFIFDAAGELVFSEAGYRDWSREENLKLIRSAKQ
jgi:hypothetical protein